MTMTDAEALAKINAFENEIYELGADAQQVQGALEMAQIIRMSNHNDAILMVLRLLMGKHLESEPEKSFWTRRKGDEQ